MNTLANGDVTKYESILDTPAETIFFTLLFEKDKAEFEKKLTEIRQRNYELSRNR